MSSRLSALRDSGSDRVSSLKLNSNAISFVPFAVRRKTDSSIPVFPAKKGVTFATIPLEIRLQICEYVLVSRWDSKGERLEAEQERYNRFEGAKRKIGEKIRLNLSWGGRGGETITPALLRTCKQIYNEANMMLYSENIFQALAPHHFTGWSCHVEKNIQYLKTLVIKPSSFGDLHNSPWPRFFQLRKIAPGLRHMVIEFEAQTKFCRHAPGIGFGLDWPERNIVAEGRGHGDRVDFIRSFATEMRGRLESLKISGFYGLRWKAYLERELGFEIEATCGHEPDDIGYFRAYQRGTIDLYP